MADLLRAAQGPINPSALVAELGPKVRDLASGASRLLAEEARNQSAKMRSDFIEAGAPAAEAAMVAKLFDLDGAIGIGQLAQESRTDVLRLTQAFVDLGARLGLDWAQHVAARMSPSDTWERLLVNGLARDFQQMRLDFLRHRQGRKGDPVNTVNLWADEHTVAIAQFRAMVARAQSAAQVSPVMLAEIAGQARNLLAR
jgi:glutamate dehydrogenase